MSATLSKIEALKAAFEKKNTGGGGNQNWKLFYRFWKIPDDSRAVVRFLPDLDEGNGLGFLVENLQHNLIINGDKKTVGCLQMYGEKCPICDLSRKYYDNKDEDMGKRYYRKKSYIGQIIVIESPIEHDQNQLVKLIDFGPAVFKQIQAAFQSGDLDEAPYELKGGYNFRIIKTKSGQYASYSTSSFAPKQTDLDDDVIESLQLFNLSDYRSEKLPLETIEAMLIADQTGSSFEESGNDDHDGDEKEILKPSDSKSEKKDESSPEEKIAEAPTTDESAGSSTKASSILEQLRARARAAKSE